jgi:hypothetical protein
MRPLFSKKMPFKQMFYDRLKLIGFALLVCVWELSCMVLNPDSIYPVYGMILFSFVCTLIFWLGRKEDKKINWIYFLLIWIVANCLCLAAWSVRVVVIANPFSLFTDLFLLGGISWILKIFDKKAHKYFEIHHKRARKHA